MKNLDLRKLRATTRLTVVNAASILVSKAAQQFKKPEMSIKWGFFHDRSGRFRWEVRGDEGPIATSGNRFDALEDCVADARARGFRGPAEPAVSDESTPRLREVRSAKSSVR